MSTIQINLMLNQRGSTAAAVAVLINWTNFPVFGCLDNKYHVKKWSVDLKFYIKLISTFYLSPLRFEISHELLAFVWSNVCELSQKLKMYTIWKWSVINNEHMHTHTHTQVSFSLTCIRTHTQTILNNTNINQTGYNFFLNYTRSLTSSTNTQNEMIKKKSCNANPPKS